MDSFTKLRATKIQNNLGKKKPAKKVSQNKVTNQNMNSPRKWNADIHKKFQDAYEKFDKGLYSKKRFKNIIKKDLNLETSEQFDKILHLNHFNYSNIVRSLPIGRERDQYKTNVKPVTEYYHRYKTNPEYPEMKQIFQSPDQDRQQVIDSVREYVQGNLPQDDLKKVLQKNNLNYDKIDNQLRNFQANNDRKLQQIGPLVYRELHIDNDYQPTKLSPSKTKINDLKLLAYNDKFKGFDDIPEKFDLKVTDNQNKYQMLRQVQLQSIGGSERQAQSNTYLERKRPIQIRAYQDNGDFITWDKATTIDSHNKSQVKRNYKYSNKTQNELSNRLVSKKLGPKNYNSKRPNAQMTRSSGVNIITWNVE